MLTWLSPSGKLLTMNRDVQTTDDRFRVQSEYRKERNLWINNVRIDDAGTYQCKLSQHQTLAEVQLIVNGTLPWPVVEIWVYIGNSQGSRGNPVEMGITKLVSWE